MQIPASHHSEPTEPIHLQNQLEFTSYSTGKTTDVESVDRPVGKKRCEPIRQVTTPPPTPSKYNIHNLSQLIVLSCLSQHVTSLHFLMLTLCLTLLHLRINQQFSDPLERTWCSSLFILRKASLTKALLKELADSENTHFFLQLLYNKTLPSAARPFEHKFGSPKPKNNLLTNEFQHKSQSPSKSHSSHQPVSKAHSLLQLPEFDSEMDTIPSVNRFNNPKYQPNSINAVPKAIPISPSALKNEKEDHRRTVAATARGVFNSYGGVFSSIGTGVSTFIPQGIFQMD